MLRYAVVGSGAVGGFYGVRLAAAGTPVQFLLRHEAEFVRGAGLRLTSPDGDILLPHVDVAASWDELRPCDVLVVAVKSTSNSAVHDSLLTHADRILGAGGTVLLAQNGIGAEAGYARASGDREVLGGLAFLCSQRRGPGWIDHLDYGSLTIAAHTRDEAPGGITPNMVAVADDLRAAGLEAILDEDLVLARWRKLLWNIPFNSLSVILDATTDQLMADPDTVELVRSLMHEVVAAAAAEGRRLPPGVVEQLLAATRAMRPYATSMKLDADAGRPLEVDSILAEPLRRAERAGCPMPGVDVLHRELAFVDHRIRAAEPGGHRPR